MLVLYIAAGIYLGGLLLAITLYYVSSWSPGIRRDSHDNLVVIRSVRNEAAATVIVNALSEAGVTSKTAGEFTAGFRTEALGNVKVLIQPSDVGKANAVLDNICSSEEIDWDNIDVGEPEE